MKINTTYLLLTGGGMLGGGGATAKACPNLSEKDRNIATGMQLLGAILIVAGIFLPSK